MKTVVRDLVANTYEMGSLNFSPTFPFRRAAWAPKGVVVVVVVVGGWMGVRMRGGGRWEAEGV